MSTELQPAAPSRRDDAVALSLLGAIFLVLFGDLLSGAALHGRDLYLYHYGMKRVVRDLILGGHFPYWNRLFSAGQPLAANPAYELFYPLQLPILLPDFVFGFQLHIVIHILLAAAGMYLLLRQLRAGAGGAFFGAASFAFGGMVVSFAQVLPFLFSVTWIPWVLLFGARWTETRRAREVAFAAMAMAMQVLIGEPLVMAQTCGLLLFGAFLAARDHEGPHARRDALVAAMATIVGAILLGAVQLIPAIDFTRDSVRSVPFDFSMVGKWSLPVVRPVEFLFPQWAGSVSGDGALYHGGPLLYGAAVPFIYSIYVGLPIAIAAIAGLLRRIPGWRAAAAVIAISYVLAIGRHTPLLRLIYASNSVLSFRFPEKFFISAVVVVIIFGAMSLQRILDGDRQLLRTALIVTTAAAVFALAMTAMAFLTVYPALFPALWRLPPMFNGEVLGVIARQAWILTTVRIVVAGALLLVIQRLPRRTGHAALLLFFLLDVLPQSLQTLAPRDREYLDPPPILASLGDGGRIFNQAALERMRLAPTSLKRDQMYWASRNGLYPYLSANWGQATVMEADFDQTGLLNVHAFNDVAYASMARNDPSWPDLFLRLTNARTRLTKLDERAEFARAARPELAPVVRIERGPDSRRYWFASTAVAISSPRDLDAIARNGSAPSGAAFTPASFASAHAVVDRAVERPNDATLQVTASGRAFLVASVTNHRYWTATIDGTPAAIVPANICFQGVVVPPGHHTIVFRYRNPMIPLGAIVSLLALTAVVVVIVRS